MKLNKKGIITGVANEKSIAYGCADVLRSADCDFLITYGRDKTLEHIQPLVKKLGIAEPILCNVVSDDHVDNLFEIARQKWGTIDFLIHSLAFADKSTLQGRVVDSSWDGFAQAINISCHSFLRLAKHAEKLMPKGGVLITMTYYGSEKVIDNYGVMGPVKACLESCVKYAAYELANAKIRVFAISAGPVHTRAASGIKNFDKLADESQARSALGRLVSTKEIGDVAAFLISDLSSGMTGNTIYVDCGANMKG